MRPSPAEIVRTLVAGRLPALAHLAHQAGPHHVRHVTDPDGRVLLLVPVVSDLAAALLSDNSSSARLTPRRDLEPSPSEGHADVALVLDVLDLPPTAGAPSLGRAWVSGWAARLDGDEARRAALDFAAVDPTGELLDVGTRFHLFRFEVAEARWERAGSVRRIDPGAYAEAEPDPLHPVEAELLADLADHHADQVGAYVRRQLGLADDAAGPPRVVRIDRYGLVVSYGRPVARRRARLAFPQPVADHAELARLLHPILCRRASTRPAPDGA